MKKWRIIPVLLLCIVLAGSVSCNPFGGEEQVSENLVEVVRGDLTIAVSGSGNLEVSKDVELAFGSGGKIETIYVEEGDEVSEGDVLAKLDTDALELALTEARVAYYQAQVAVTEAEVAVTQAEAAVAQAEIDLKNAEIDLEQTQETYTLSEIKAAQADLDVKKRNLEEALRTLYKYEQGTPGYKEYQKIVARAQASVNTAEDLLDAMLSGFSTKEVAAKEMEVNYARQSLELAKQSLELAKQSPELKRQSLQLEKQSLEQAQKQLDEATITAQFDGIVARTYADEGDVIPPPSLTSTPIIKLIDPGNLELNVEVDEIDVPGVKKGQKVIINVDALPSTPIEGEVDFIFPTATEESGLVTYKVKIDFAIPEGSGLRAGMSATADIVINERSDVLLVPERAIEQDSEGNPIVDVMVNQQIEKRTVVTGISDGFQTEILNGLEEGEMVIEKRIKPKSSAPGLF
ncbi:efflux RND transporter periplasmic adaptor subunit [Chloroflexota bacterium]